MDVKYDKSTYNIDHTDSVINWLCTKVSKIKEKLTKSLFLCAPLSFAPFLYHFYTIYIADFNLHWGPLKVSRK